MKANKLAATVATLAREAMIEKNAEILSDLGEDLLEYHSEVLTEGPERTRVGQRSKLAVRGQDGQSVVVEITVTRTYPRPA